MKISIDKEYEGERVDKVLSKILNISRSSLDNVDISCNGKIIKSSYKLKENDIIEFELNEKNDEIILIPQDIPIDIVYEDEYIAVINKSYDMVVHPSITTKENTLVNALLHHFDTLSDNNVGKPAACASTETIGNPSNKEGSISISEAIIS